MSKDVRRFAGFDYKPRHQYKGDQAILSVYANGLRTRALERVAAAVEADQEIKNLRDDHRYLEVNAKVRYLLAEAELSVERELLEVGKEGIPVPNDLESRLNALAI